VVTVPVLEADGEKAAGIRALDVLVENQRLTRQVLAGIDDQVIIAGERAGDVSEHEYLARTGLRRHGVDDLERALDGLRGPVYVHVDLDVLEPAAFGSTCYPEPNGVPPQRLIDLVCQVSDIVGAAITEHAPAGDDVNRDEAEVIRRLAAALAR
jgi:arginase